MTTSNQIYTVERLTEHHLIYDEALMNYCLSVARRESDLYGDKYNYFNFDLETYVRENMVWICYRNGKPVGVMMARLLTSIFDDNLPLLYQDLLFCESGTRAVKYLMQAFIDFGRQNAKHLITMIGAKTNLKSHSLVKMGFQELETLYRLEV